MHTSITIRNVPVEVLDELAARAARSGRSLEDYLLEELIGVASLPDPAELVVSVREHVGRTGSQLSPDEIIGYIEADRK